MKTSVRRKSVSKLRLRGRAKELLPEWEAGLESIAIEMSTAKSRQSSIKSEQPDAVMKTAVYSFVGDIFVNFGSDALEQVLEYKITGTIPKVKFLQNPFYWVFKAIAEDGEVSCDARSISRYGKELLYAYQHKIPAELLIGFISQVGGIKVISKKLNEEQKESWFVPNLNWV